MTLIPRPTDRINVQKKPGKSRAPFANAIVLKLLERTTITIDLPKLMLASGIAIALIIESLNGSGIAATLADAAKILTSKY